MKTHLEKSMEFERAYATVVNIKHDVNVMYTNAADEAARNGDPEPTHFRLILDVLSKTQDTFRELSDLEWERHKKSDSMIDTDGIQDLFNAIVISAVEDYEAAISSGRPGGNGVRRAIREWAKKEEGRLTGTSISDILSRIDAYYPKFKEYVRSNLNDIIKDSKRAKTAEEYKFHCPMCGGGLHYATRGGEHRVLCTGCNLSVLIDD